jgi:hypothetical protein
LFDCELVERLVLVERLDHIIPIRPDAVRLVATARPPEPGVSGWGMVLVKGLLAFAVAFGFTSWVLIPVLSPAPAPPDTDSPSSMPSASPSSATTAPAAAPDADAER